jgi:hypothetical protein
VWNWVANPVVALVITSFFSGRLDKKQSGHEHSSIVG